jgi:hypothetical protein
MSLLLWPMTVSNALSRRINAQGYAIMRAQIAACLLCLLIVGASLDGLPDPPAVKPQRNQNTLISQVGHHIPFTAKNQALVCLANVPHFQASLLSLGQVSEGKGPSFDPDFVLEATDTSPPCFS